ncbi:SDR family oxidoreductase [Chryseobacterium geocarposphaerae]|uniref:Nucleoside-diphosphate-sugar epimerase n=1 Tax=Chryseobacterium geocarposphaerae TaxID=1416776 RepID=A0A2M9C5S9_9FLAO|nr:SDR family oxidoreductase [Chryseobacterium geocarposphaerae]PJJ66197.1 nucleoside-diphosphate-sugar epimerase [Chryseobacterium geocarposphaerae]
MKVFVTGASGFVGSAVVKELIANGHQVTGLARSEESAKFISEAGAEVLMGDLESFDILQKGAREADGVIHTAFIHDFSDYQSNALKDEKAIEAMGEVLKGTDKPIVVTGGTLGLPLINGKITEDSKAPAESVRFSEKAFVSLTEAGVNASIVRLSPSVYGNSEHGFKGGFGVILAELAKTKGTAAYIEDRNNVWPTIHRLDAAKLFRLALEKGEKGARYNAVNNDKQLSMKEFAEYIGEKLNIPVQSFSKEEASQYFTWMTYFVQENCPATSLQTQEKLGWKPSEKSFFEELEKYFF